VVQADVTLQNVCAGEDAVARLASQSLTIFSGEPACVLASYILHCSYLFRDQLWIPHP
jgi:hypothetical protein